MEFRNYIENSPDFVATNKITGIWSYLMSIDWQEPWLVGVLVMHGFLCIICYTTSTMFKTQASLFVFLLAFVYNAEYVNRLGAKYWNYFSRQQYFDSNGMFFSLVISLPFLMICLFIMVQWIRQSSSLLISLKRRQLLQKREQNSSRSTQEEKKDK